MNSFETGPSSEEIKTQTKVFEASTPAQEGIFKPEEALEKERRTLGGFVGKAKKCATGMLIVSALLAGSGVANETYAQENKQDNQIEQVQKQEKQEEGVNEAGLTESSTWSQGVVESARNDMKKIINAEDAEWLVRTHFNQFVSEYYMPTKGAVKEGVYGIKTRDYSEEDLKLLLQNTGEMKLILQELNTEFGIEAFDKRIEQINDMLTKLEMQSSYSGQKQKEALKRMEMLLQQR